MPRRCIILRIINLGSKWTEIASFTLRPLWIRGKSLLYIQERLGGSQNRPGSFDEDNKFLIMSGIEFRNKSLLTDLFRLFWLHTHTHTIQVTLISSLSILPLTYVLVIRLSYWNPENFVTGRHWYDSDTRNKSQLLLHRYLNVILRAVFCLTWTACHIAPVSTSSCTV